MSKGQKAAPRSTWGNERKENQKKWQRENRTKLSADVSKETAALFRSLCADNNTAVSAALSQYVRAAIQAGTLDIIRDDIPWTKDDDGTTAAGSIRDDDGRRDDPQGQKNIDPVFQQGDQASENDTPGTVGNPENASD